MCEKKENHSVKDIRIQKILHESKCDSKKEIRFELFFCNMMLLEIAS